MGYLGIGLERFKKGRGFSGREVKKETLRVSVIFPILTGGFSSGIGWIFLNPKR